MHLRRQCRNDCKTSEFHERFVLTIDQTRRPDNRIITRSVFQIFVRFLAEDHYSRGDAAACVHSRSRRHLSRANDYTATSTTTRTLPARGGFFFPP